MVHTALAWVVLGLSIEKARAIPYFVPYGMELVLVVIRYVSVIARAVLVPNVEKVSRAVLRTRRSHPYRKPYYPGPPVPYR